MNVLINKFKRILKEDFEQEWVLDEVMDDVITFRAVQLSVLTVDHINDLVSYGLICLYEGDYTPFDVIIGFQKEKFLEVLEKC